MKQNKFLIAVAAAGILAVAPSCTDEWDSHYESVQHGEGTLWQTICAHEEISNFKEVLEACDFKSTLDGSQVCTVFAPTNDKFSAAQRDAVISLYKSQVASGVKPSRNLALKEFVKNHIALYNHSVSLSSNDTISMMNGKYGILTTDSFSGKGIKSKNNLTNNGMLFVIDDVVDYLPNVYEYIGRDADLDSLSSYIYTYSIDKFNPSQSVPGEIIDGKTHYLDSVTRFSNQLLTDILWAEINDEDSTYLMLAPTNTVWRTLLEEFEQYFQYDKKVAGRDSLVFNFPRRAIVEGTLFSPSWNPSSSINDSILSTSGWPYAERKEKWGSYDLKYYQYDKPFDSETGIFAGAEKIECSNGTVYKTDDWKLDKRNTFFRDIVMEAESRNSLDSVYYNTAATEYPRTQTVSTANPWYACVSEHKYVEITPGGSLNIKALFDVRNVLSNHPYDLYLVTVPAQAYDMEAKNPAFKFRCAVQCNDASGNPVYVKPDNYNFKPVASEENKDVPNSALFTANSAASKDKAFTTVANQVDSLLIGTFTFPTSSYELSEPQVKFFIEGRVSGTEEKSGEYTKTLRMDCLVAVPCYGEECSHHSRTTN